MVFLSLSRSGCHQGMCAAAAPLGAPVQCHASQLSRTDGYSSPFARYFLGPRKLVFRKETFRSDLTPGRLGPVCKVPAVFSNGDSLATFGENQRQ